MLGDKAYDSAELRDELDERGTKPVIPNRCNRKQPFSFSKRLYKLRWRIESAFNRFKDFRRIATRYDRLARNYLANPISASRHHFNGLSGLQASIITCGHVSIVPGLDRHALRLDRSRRPRMPPDCRLP
jgi:hypothetical protein